MFVRGRFRTEAITNEEGYMKSNFILTVWFSVSLLFVSQGFADSHVMQNLTETQWGAAPPFLPSGAKIAVLQGNPGAAELYTVRLWFPADYKIPAHSHPTAEHVTVLSGTLYAGRGNKLDLQGGAALSVGGFALMPAGMNHYAYTKEETTILLHGMGPVEFIYVNPADDPRNAGKK
jgi:quercetin dioxygenase-like cupin family protein